MQICPVFSKFAYSIFESWAIMDGIMSIITRLNVIEMSARSTLTWSVATMEKELQYVGRAKLIMWDMGRKYAKKLREVNSL